jgi:uncharacterized protein
MSMLENDLPSYLAYHQSFHTQYVLDQVIRIAEKENVTHQELLLLKIAALYHDSGFIIQRENHENFSCEIAIKDLKGFDFSSHLIDKICGMIMATRIPQSPKSKLENILADADLEYLGTDNFLAFGQKLYKEFLYFQPGLSTKQWYDIQIKFISDHFYHTDFCRTYREPVKLQNLQMIRKKALLILE